MNCGLILRKVAAAARPLCPHCVPRVNTVPAVTLAAALRKVRRGEPAFNSRDLFIVNLLWPQLERHHCDFRTIHVNLSSIRSWSQSAAAEGEWNSTSN